MFGNPETTPGGRALKFYSSVRLDIRKIENLKDGTEVVGSRTRVKVVKNKVAPPFRQCEFDIMYGEGISKEGGLIDVGVELEIVKKSGAWFTYEGEQLGQGRENARRSSPSTPTSATRSSGRCARRSASRTSGPRGTRRRSRWCPTWSSTSEPGRSRSRGGGEGEGPQRRRVRPSATARRAWARRRPIPKSCHERALGLAGGAAAEPAGSSSGACYRRGSRPPRSKTCSCASSGSVWWTTRRSLGQVAEHEFGVKPSGRRGVASAWRRRAWPQTTSAPIAGDAPEDEQERASSWLEPGAPRALTPQKAFARLTALLVRRGYCPGLARYATRAALRLTDLGGGRTATLPVHVAATSSNQRGTLETTYHKPVRELPTPIPKPTDDRTRPPWRTGPDFRTSPTPRRRAADRGVLSHNVV